MEDVLQRLVDAGIPEEIAVRCYGLLIQLSLGFAAYQSPRRWGAEGGDSGTELRRQQQHYFAGLPTSEFPLVVSRAADLIILPTQEQFDWAVMLIARAISSRLIDNNPTS